MWCTHDAVGRLPRQVIVERGTALAVVAGRVVSANAFAVDLPIGQEAENDFKTFGSWIACAPSSTVLGLEFRAAALLL